MSNENEEGRPEGRSESRPEGRPEGRSEGRTGSRSEGRAGGRSEGRRPAASRSGRAVATPGKGKPRGSRPQAGRGKMGSGGGLKAGIFAKIRGGQDVVAFATPSRGTISLKLFVEAVDAFRDLGREPRSFVLILSQGLEAESFEAYQAPFRTVSPLLFKTKQSGGERPYWNLTFDKGPRKLGGGEGMKVDLRKVEKKPENRR